MRAFVGVTDGDWYELLATQAYLDEVNFWQPGGNRVFRVLEPGELFLFKLHSPQNFISGGGVFAHATILPISLAWDAFGRSSAICLTRSRRRSFQPRTEAGASRYRGPTLRRLGRDLAD
jgi:putative restriction endonuclease